MTLFDDIIKLFERETGIKIDTTSSEKEKELKKAADFKLNLIRKIASCPAEPLLKSLSSLSKLASQFDEVIDVPITDAEIKIIASKKTFDLYRRIKDEE